jgi:hypothetical protein
MVMIINTQKEAKNGRFMQRWWTSVDDQRHMFGGLPLRQIAGAWSLWGTHADLILRSRACAASRRMGGLMVRPAMPSIVRRQRFALPQHEGSRRPDQTLMPAPADSKCQRAKHMRSHPRGADASELCKVTSLENQRAQGMPGARSAPIASRANGRSTRA